ncbi:hypothetical protein VN97_g5790 [Penicillium thymicola]|uniref:Uncharacterized protein n=1 Tax=Penicillium thymicola TaxID=293382 RepID=A0AAI9X826_PENTH|nr:hypothetical protein VN97_g5790 [Penicillium thymicola]
MIRQETSELKPQIQVPPDIRPFHFSRNIHTEPTRLFHVVVVSLRRFAAIESRQGVIDAKPQGLSVLTCHEDHELRDKGTFAPAIKH